MDTYRRENDMLAAKGLVSGDWTAYKETIYEGGTIGTSGGKAYGTSWRRRLSDGGMGMNCLGIELGSTRIKAAVIDGNSRVIATGSHTWENRLADGYWTYNLDDVWAGLRDAVSQLGGVRVDALGISAMMHGYLAFDKDGNLLVPFRTWRNTNTERAAGLLSEAFNFNIPLRWSIAHLYQAILDDEPHVQDIAYITTLAGYVHYKLTGEFVLGVGDASGMFPIGDGGYDWDMLAKWGELAAGRGLPWKLADVLPKIMLAGESAGRLTAEGAALLGGVLPAGTLLCPPEGDAGTGMVATNAVKPRTGNVSAGTSVFAMVVLERPLKSRYPAIDVVTTPWGLPVAMVHANECCSLIDPWVRLFGEAARRLGAGFDDGKLFTTLYEAAVAEDSPLSAFMRGKLQEACAELRDGLKILTEREGVKIDGLAGHGGYFKSGQAGRVVMSEALGIPVTLAENAAEGGAFGAALLAAQLGLS